MYVMSPERNMRPVGWVLFILQGAVLVLIVSYSWYISGKGFEELKVVNLIAAFTGTLSALFLLKVGRVTDDIQADNESREKAVIRSKKQRSQGVVWYAAPVFWLPILLLSAIWAFR